MQPGEAGRIPLKIHTGSVSGNINKAVTIYTNIDGPNGILTINLKGETWLPIDVSPRNVLFGRLGRGDLEKGAVRKVTVINNTETPLKPTEVKSTNPAFQAELTTLEEGKKYELSVSMVTAEGTEIRQGNIAGNIEFATGSAESPKQSIPVSVFITADVDVTPDNIMLPSGRTADTTRQVFVRNNSKNPIKLSELKVESGQLTATVQETSPGMNFSITVNIPAGYKAPLTGDKLTFQTDCPTMPLVTVPITERQMPAAIPGPQPNLGATPQPHLGATPPTGVQRPPATGVSPAPAGGTPPATGGPKPTPVPVTKEADPTGAKPAPPTEQPTEKKH